MDDLWLNELSDLIKAERWEEAYKYADSVSNILRMNFRIEKESSETKLLHWHPRRYESPSSRCWRVLERLSKYKLIHAVEANKIIKKLAQRYSGNWTHTARSLYLPDDRSGGWYMGDKFHICSYLWRGNLIHLNKPDHEELIAEAKAKGIKFCDLRKRKKLKEEYLQRKESESLSLRAFINATKREIDTHVKNSENMR